MSLLREILRDIALPSVGCTEPAAIALAAATAREAVGGTVEHLRVIVDPNTFKNAMAVTIPNTDGKTGIAVAVALGGLYGNPELKLEIFKDMPSKASEIVGQIISQNRVQVDIEPEQLPVYIEATVKTSQGSGRAVIKGQHTNVVLIEVNGEVKLNRSAAAELQETAGAAANKLLGMKILDIIQLATTLEPGNMRFLLDGADMNMAIAKEGLSRRFSLAIGASLQDMVNKGLLSDDFVNEAKILTAAAVDARMAGSSLPVMSIGGSGNQGITTVIPIVVVARRIGSSKLKLATALALGYLFAAYARAKIGGLSTICGSVVASAIGAGVGIVRLFDKSEEEIEKAVNTIVSNVIGNVAGMLCCGANGACALKLATGSGVAIETAFLAEQNTSVAARNGIIGNSTEASLDNLRLVNKGMGEVERTILNIMMANTWSRHVG